MTDPTTDKAVSQVDDVAGVVEEAAELERRYSRGHKDYRQWYVSQNPLEPEDEGREVEFAFGDGWRLGYEAAATLLEQQAQDLARVREALSFAATRFEVCAGFIADSRAISGTLRAERTIKARRFAAEALEALSDTPHPSLDTST